MKNSKLLVAFFAGVAVACLCFKFFPNGPSSIHDGGSWFGELAVIAMILGAGFFTTSLIASEAEGETRGLASKFFNFLKNLRTSPRDSWIGGVCGGLATSTPIPSWVWRLCFAALVLYYGFWLLFLAYLLLWIFIPEGDLQKQNPA
jgi:phage shock protein C